MALAVVEPHGLHARIAVQGPGEARRGVLAAREEHEGGVGHRPHMGRKPRPEKQVPQPRRHGSYGVAKATLTRAILYTVRLTLTVCRSVASVRPAERGATP